MNPPSPEPSRATQAVILAAGLGGKTGARAYVGGTLSANPLSCAAGYHAILEMERTGAPAIAGRAGDRLTAGLQQIIERRRLPFVAYNQGSIVHLETAGVMLLDLRSPLKLAREVKPWPGLVDVEPMPGDDSDATGGERSAESTRSSSDDSPPEEGAAAE